MDFPDKIETIEDALKIIRKIKHDVKTGIRLPFYDHHTLNNKSLFTDIWYRGEEEEFPNPLLPKIFRNQYDETIIFNYLPTYIMELREIEDDFDRLCYMQHYGAPTRLLDWTDNILVALYFAVKASPDKDGIIYILNSRLLNYYTGLRKGNKNILNKDNLGTIIRCLMIHSDSSKEWQDKFKKVVQFDWKRDDLNDVPLKKILKTTKDHISENLDEQMKAFSTPVSVRPDKSNNRILHQGGLFTIHGGKNHIVSDRINSRMRIPPPKSLIELNNIGKFILKFHIPAKSKETIKDDLLFLQIHEGKMFPELEKQNEFIKLIGLKE